MNIKAFIFDDSTFKLKVLDQTQLPTKLEFIDIDGTVDGFDSIRRMLVRGAPCIAAVACLSIISELHSSAGSIATTQDLCVWLGDKRDHLIPARPTAVNLKQALNRLVKFSYDKINLDIESAKSEITKFCLRALRIGLDSNMRLGRLGAEEVIRNSSSSGFAGKVAILTHCNTGALATVGHGTALGVIRTLFKMGKLEKAYCTETRPYNQGSRLTAWELVTENIPTTLIADSMVAYLMATRKIHAAIVGADRVAANGDTANKIGTLQIAVVARHYDVPFYVAAPTQSIDLATETGEAMVIEQRPADELRKIGPVQLAPEAADVWNPCFDITPANLIAGIMTELGTCRPDRLPEFLKSSRGGEEDPLF